MDKKSELFDLRREKQELDLFLSTIVDEDAPPDAKHAPPSGKVEELLHFEPDFEPDLQPDKPVFAFPASLEAEKKEPPREAASRKDTTIISPESHDFFAKAADQGLPKIPVPAFTKREKSGGAATPFDVKLDIPKESDGQPSGEGAADKPIVVPEKKPEPGDRYDFAPKQKSGSRIAIAALLIFLIILVVIAGYLYLYPERGQKAFEWFRAAVPSVGKIFDGGSQTAIEEVKILDVRQRLVSNTQLKKSIRVIEGAAHNASSHEISRINIAAQLYDGKGDMLSTMTVMAGNLLTDEQIEKFDSERMVSALQNQATAKRNVLPNEKVPFMVVFPQEPSGISKMSVFAVGFEKK